MRASSLWRIAARETPFPPGSSCRDLVEMEANEIGHRPPAKESTALFTRSTVRFRLGSYTFSLSQGRSSAFWFDSDTDFTTFVSLVGFDQVHFRKFVVTVPDELFHPFGLGA